MDEDSRGLMLTNLRVNREIMAAWRGEFGEDDDDVNPRGSESSVPAD